MSPHGEYLVGDAVSDREVSGRAVGVEIGVVGTGEGGFPGGKVVVISFGSLVLAVSGS